MKQKKYPQPRKSQCRECALLSGRAARKQRKLYGPKQLSEVLDFCWDDSVCPRRRNYYQNAENENSSRRAARATERSSAGDGIDVISVPDPDLETPFVAYLYLYRDEPKRARTHAIAGAVYRDKEKIADIEPFHCGGHEPAWTEAKVEMILFRLRSQFGIRKFETFTRFDPVKCPIRPCPLHPAIEGDENG